MGDYSLTMHERTKSNANSCTSTFRFARCDFPVAPYSAPYHDYAHGIGSCSAQHLSPESSTCRPDNQSRPRLYLGSTTTRVAPHLNVAPRRWGGHMSMCRRVIRTRIGAPRSSISQAGPEREPGAGTKPGRSRSRGPWRMRLLVLFITVHLLVTSS